jgi:hypothetical protein
VEATQLTSTPIVVASMAGLFLTAAGWPALAAVGLAMPLAGPTDLVAKGRADAGTVVADLPSRRWRLPGRRQPLVPLGATELTASCRWWTGSWMK